MSSQDAVLIPVAMAETITRWLEGTDTGHEEKALALDLAKLMLCAPRPHRVRMSEFMDVFVHANGVPTPSLHMPGTPKFQNPE